MKAAALLAAGLLAGLVGSAAAEDAHFRTRAHIAATAGDPAADAEAEVTFGRQVAARVLGRNPLLLDDELTRYVNLVGKAVALHGSRPEIEYRFAVVRSEQVNAYATPGGYVFITTGALALMRDEAELAAVLAHEIAHVNQRHIVKRLNIKADDDSALVGATLFLGGAGDPTRVAFTQALDQAVGILFSDGLDKADELEADRVGTELLAHTGYDPSALHRFLERVRQQAGGEQLNVLSHTHPPLDERLGKLRHELHQQGFAALRLPTVQERFHANVR